MKQLARVNSARLVALLLGFVGLSCTTSRGLQETTSAYTPPSVTAASHTAPQAPAQAAYGKLPLHFEANQGQSDPQVKFLSRGSGYTLFLTPTEAVLALRQNPEASSQQSEFQPQPPIPNPQSSTELRMHLVGANPHPQVTGLDELPGKSNYFFGNDPAQWHTNIPTYAKVKYENVYPGIDLVYYGNQQQLEYDFVVAPGTDPKIIRLGFAAPVGAGCKPTPTIDSVGDLIVQTASGELRFHQPRIYQDTNGNKHPIAGRYVLFDSETADSGLRTQQVGFEVAAYDTTKPLVIDPVLVYSTYVGGDNHEAGAGIAVDASGNAYVTGFTGSSNFRTTTGTFRRLGQGGSVFVTKLNPTGSALVYSTYFGGSGSDAPRDITVDTAGNVYVAGITSSSDFPTTAEALQKTCHKDTLDNCADAFVVKLNSTGLALLYATYLGSSGVDTAEGIAVDSESNAYVTGSVSSVSLTDFPTTPGAFQPTCRADNFAPLCDDAFVAKLNPTGSALVYATYLGGGSSASLGAEWGNGIAVDAAGNAYVTGTTFSSDFPTTAGAFQQSCAASICNDAFVVKLNSTGAALLYSTYLGGIGSEVGNSVTVDAGGNAYVTGASGSPDFPTTPETVRTTPTNGFVTKLNPIGSALVYSSYFDQAKSIAVDTGGNAYLAGTTRTASASSACSTPLCPLQTAFVAKVNATGTSLVYSLSLGGKSGSLRDDEASDIAVDASGDVYVTGRTNALDFPTTDGGLQTTYGGGFSDVFISKITDKPPGIIATFESPEAGSVSGIDAIHGWAFDTEAGARISSIKLFIDGILIDDISCCSERPDVQTAFPEFPSDNTLHSGWGIAFNWGLLSTGEHTVKVELQNTRGELFFPETRTVTVVRPGDFEFLDRFDLSGATVGIVDDTLIVEGVVVRDKTTQQQKRINARFHWLPGSQSFGMMETQTLATLAFSRSPFSSLLTWLSPRLLDWQAMANAQAFPIIQASFESPEEGQVVSGIGVIRGWTFAETEATLPLLRLFIDGQVGPLVPCCSARADVAAAFPAIPHALNSGWGTIFNYNLLSAGNHTIQVGLDYRGLIIFLPLHTITVVKPGGFEFLDQFDLSAATARIEGENIILNGVAVRDKASQQNKTVEMRLRWSESMQGLQIVAASN